MSDDIDPLRVLLLVLWSGSGVLAYGFVFQRRLVAWHRHRDARSKRELVWGFGLFLAAISAAISAAFVIAGPPSAGLVAVLVAVAYGSFVAAGIVMAQESSREEHEE